MRGLLVAALAALLLVAGCGGNGDAESSGDGGGGNTCEQVENPAPREAPVLEAPSGTLDPQKTYELLFETSCGNFTVTLDQRLAPETTKSLVALAEEGFYDDTVFHRIVPGFVIQGGDPTATGTGGPGYQTVDAPEPSTEYPFGTVAMAKGAADPPGTAGSQFFVVTAPDAQLPPEYAVIGRVTDGSDVVMRIGMLGDPATEQPTQPVVIESIEIERS